MRVLMTALFLSVSTTISHGAFADNIAGCEVVLMEKIKQQDNEGVTEIASFRPAADFIASAYDEELEILREIDGLPIRAIMCKRKSVVPGESDFPIVATGTPFMISQNFDSTETGLTTIYFKDGEFRSDYKGPDLSEKVEAELKARLKAFNAKPHDLAAKEKAMLEKIEASNDKEPTLDEVASEDELLGVSKEEAKTDSVASEDELIAASKDEGEAASTEETSTDKTDSKDDRPAESAEKENASAKKDMDPISPEELKKVE